MTPTQTKQFSEALLADLTRHCATFREGLVAYTGSEEIVDKVLEGVKESLEGLFGLMAKNNAEYQIVMAASLMIFRDSILNGLARQATEDEAVVEGVANDTVN